MSTRLRYYTLKYWKTIVIYGSLYAVLCSVLYWQLGTLTPGYSVTEWHTYQAALQWRTLLDNPLNAPLILAVKAATYLIPDSLLAVRLVSAGVGLAVLAIFTTLLRVWHDRQTAVIGTLLFGLSAWFLHIARLGTPDILFFGISVLAACGYWLKQTGSTRALLGCILGATALMYVPGMIWFIALGVICQWKMLDRNFRRHLPVTVVGSLLALTALVPLGWALYKQHTLIKPLLGLPDQFQSLPEIGRNLLEAPYHLLISNEANPIAWLGTAPIFDAFSLTMLVVGAYLYLRHGGLARTQLAIAFLLLTMSLMAIGSSVTFSVIIPFLYLLVAAGTAYVLRQWLQVFPRNPIARHVGFALFYGLICLACAYHLTHYFVGWPHAQATYDIFTIQKP